MRGGSALAGPHGILLVDKAEGRTSHDVVARVRWLLGTKKVGHAGTLDPMATGLLVLGVGQGTRLLTHLVGLDKTYRATIRLGRATVTDDREGEALGEDRPANEIPGNAINNALEALRGPIQQVPSSVSAIKVDGQRSYARVRAGEDVELPSRPVVIHRLDRDDARVEGTFLDLDVSVRCSSGTYVRALARDLGASLGVGGHLTALRRMDVGPFDVAGAVHVPARGEGDDVELPLQGLGRTASEVLPTLPVDDTQALDLSNGRRISADPATEPAEASASAAVAALDPAGRLVAVLEREGARWRPTLVVPAEARS